jgi:hypothetical protein
LIEDLKDVEMGNPRIGIDAYVMQEEQPRRLTTLRGLET